VTHFQRQARMYGEREEVIVRGAADVLTEVEFYVPIRTVSEANARDHWRVRNARKKGQQEAAYFAFKGATRGRAVKLPCVVRFLRIGPHRLDSDNLAGAFKGIRDQLAQLLGADDGSDLIRWEYDQCAIGERSYNVKVQVRSL
jgi:hypothetical protein